MSGKHCRECGAELIERELEHEGIVPYCPECGKFRFPQYNVAVSMIVVNESTGKILLINQYGKPYYMLVAGYVNRGESLEDAVSREVREETGMTVVRKRFNKSGFYAGTGTLMCNFVAYVADDSELDTNYEVDAYRWFTPEEARENIIMDIAKGFLEAYLDDLG
ncbi:MAG: NAD(+) diphosphatase [Coriobacteriales bacterium]